MNSAIVDVVATYSRSPQMWTVLRDVLYREKKDELYMNCNTLQDERSTSLLSAISNSLESSQFSVGAIMLLALQSEQLPDKVSFTFFQLALVALTRDGSKSEYVFVHKEVVIISRKLVEIVVSAERNKRYSKRLIAPFALLALAIAPTRHCLTPLHTMFLQACLLSQMYNVAVDFLGENEVLEVNPPKTSLTPLDYLCYFYYAGICYISVKDFDSALESFVETIVTPAKGLSKVVVEATKKAKLVSLIHHGRSLKIPKNTSSVVSRHMRDGYALYDKIAKLFLENDVKSLKDLLSSEHEVTALHGDGNLGLAKQLLPALTRHRVVQLSRIYTALSLDELTRLADLPDNASCERLVLKLVEGGNLSASIDDKEGVISFLGQGDASLGSNDELAKVLKFSLDMNLRLSEALKTRHEQVLTSQQYISRLSKARAEGAEDISGGAASGSSFKGGGGIGGTIDWEHDGGDDMDIDDYSHIAQPNSYSLGDHQVPQHPFGNFVS